jgi:APA family basic amino acid/polyamine antiporter
MATWHREPGSAELTARLCRKASDQAVVCSKEALAWTLREIGWPQIGNLIGLAAGLALPSVMLMMMFGQTRIFFVMSRDGLLPEVVLEGPSAYNTPHVITMITGMFVALFAAFFPVGALANISNSGTLFAFAAVSVAVLVIRRREPGRHRPFRTPAIYVTSPLAFLGCLYLFYKLDSKSQMLFVVWAAIGLVVYYGYSRSRSHVGRGSVEVHEMDGDVPPTSVPPID